MRWALRLALAAGALLWLGYSTIAAAGPLDTIIESFSPLLYWSLAADATATVGGSANNGTCASSCTYGLTMATNAVGFHPATTADRINLTISAPTFTPPTVVASTFTQLALFKTSSSAQQTLWSNNNTFKYGTVMAIADTGGGRCGGTLGEFLLTGSDGSVVPVCTSGSVTDGSMHLIVATCAWSVPTLACSLYLDATLQNTGSSGGFSLTGGTSYAFGNDDFGSSFAMQGPMAAVALIPGELTTTQQLDILNCATGAGSCGGAGGAGPMLIAPE